MHKISSGTEQQCLLKTRT